MKQAINRGVFVADLLYMFLYLLPAAIYDMCGRAPDACFIEPPGGQAQGPDAIWPRKHAVGLVDRFHLLELIEMASNAYYSHDLDTVLARFGYDGDGLRAKAFDHGGRVVVAFKGTTPSAMGLRTGRTSRKDKLLDRVLYSVCRYKGCEDDKARDFNAIGYFGDAVEIVESVRKSYSGRELVLTGHSLGGTVASLLGARYGLPVVAFSSPGDAYIASILGIYDAGASYDRIVHIGMCNDIVFRGECSEPYTACSIFGYPVETRCHIGRTLCIEDGRRDSLAYHSIGVMKAKITSLDDLVLVERSENTNCIH